MGSFLHTPVVGNEASWKSQERQLIGVKPVACRYNASGLPWGLSRKMPRDRQGQPSGDPGSGLVLRAGVGCEFEINFFGAPDDRKGHHLANTNVFE